MYKTKEIPDHAPEPISSPIGIWEDGSGETWGLFVCRDGIWLVGEDKSGETTWRKKARIPLANLLMKVGEPYEK